MRFLILIAVLALVTMASSERLGGPKAQLQPKPLQGAAPAEPVNGTMPALNSTAVNTTAASTTGASTTEAGTTEASTTVASKTVLAKA